ncbi:MAG: hotdog domain-containing protein [Planctomycetota bacterium]
MTEDKNHRKPEQEPAIKVSMMPRDTNVHNTIFGGVLLSYIDLAGSVHSRTQAGCDRVVTIAMKEVIFKEPVYVGDVVSFICQTQRVGRTSVTVKVEVWAERFANRRKSVWVTEAVVTYVNVDSGRRPLPIEDNND